MASKVVRHEVVIREWSQDLGECPCQPHLTRAPVLTRDNRTETTEGRGRKPLPSSEAQDLTPGNRVLEPTGAVSALFETCSSLGQHRQVRCGVQLQ
jgi:hypothetical protein